VPQGRFASELGDGMLAAVGPDRHAWLYRLRSLLEAGMAPRAVPAAPSSPCTSPAPAPPGPAAFLSRVDGTSTRL
jgi:hypothetical protein